MIEVKTVRELFCRMCGFLKRLRKDEPDPKSCPACSDVSSVTWTQKSNPDSWTHDDF